MAEATVGLSKSANEDEVAERTIEAKPTCPNCGSTEFKKVPNDRPQYALVCQGCRMGWHESDLVGARYEYLKSKK